MPTQNTQPGSDQPFTAVVCHAGPCARHGPELLQRLRRVIRHCPHGVLISSGCLLRAPRCRAAPAHDSGAYLVVQPCDSTRTPNGRAIGVGPVLSTRDAAAVATWLAGRSMDASQLDPQLRAASGLHPDC
jgi:hypothetical protein